MMCGAQIWANLLKLTGLRARCRTAPCRQMTAVCNFILCLDSWDWLTKLLVGFAQKLKSLEADVNLHLLVGRHSQPSVCTLFPFLVFLCLLKLKEKSFCLCCTSMYSQCQCGERHSKFFDGTSQFSRAFLLFILKCFFFSFCTPICEVRYPTTAYS